MTAELFATVDKLDQVITNIQRCLQCPICLHVISDPVKTRCGHRFCRACIQTVIEQQNASCPLCNSVLVRRNISKDEHVQVYIERLQDLIESVQKDSGIEISSHALIPRSTRESLSPKRNEHVKINTAGPSDRRSSSVNAWDLKKPSSRRPSRNVQTSNRASIRGKVKLEDRNKNKIKKATSETGRLAKYAKYGLSGVQSLPADGPSNYPNDNSTETRVQSWLKALPNSESLDDPNGNAPVLVDCTLDDTLTRSVSESYRPGKSNENGEAATKLPGPANDNDESCPRERRLSKSCARNGNNGKSSKSRDNAKLPLTRYSGPIDFDNPIPSTSGIKRSNDTSKDKNASLESVCNQGKTIDVPRTSPCNMLPAIKQNWSSVVKSGKELRTKKKRLKSLNVSVEKVKPRSGNESAKVIQNTSASENWINAGADKDRLENEKRIDVGSTRAREPDPAENREREASPKNISNASTSEGIQAAHESSYIALEEGQMVRINNLNSCQMKEIIGVVSTQELKDDSAKRAVEPSKPEGPSESDDSRRNPLLSKTKIAGPANDTPLRNRLSLKKRSTDPKSNDSTSPNVESRLAVKRNLNRQMDRNEDVNEKLTVETKDRVQGTDRLSTFSIGSRISNGSRRGREKSRGNKCLVQFKKLGKIWKRSKKNVNFLYLGTTKRESFVLNKSVFSAETPCNPIELQDVQDVQKTCTSENRFGNNTRITINNVENNVSLHKTNPMEIETVPREIEKEKSHTTLQNELSFNKATYTKRIDMYEDNPSKVTLTTNSGASKSQDSEDVLFVSIHENEQEPINEENVQSDPVEGSSMKSVPRNIVSKRAIRMLSPKKDSQLKFLATESPTDTLQFSKFVEQPKKSGFPEIRGAHSRALIRRSQQPSEGSGADSSSSFGRKRKRTIKLLDGRKGDPTNIEKDLLNDGDQSDASTSSKATCITVPVSDDKEVPGTYTKESKRRHTVSSNSRDVDVASLSSEAKSTDYEGAGGQKKAYKRIIYLPSSDTDSPDVVCIGDKAGNVTGANGPAQADVSPTSKRKRTTSSDSDCDIELNEIVTNWLTDLNHLERQKKKGKVEQPSASNIPRERRNDGLLKGQKPSALGSALQREQTFDSDVVPIFERSSPLAAKSQEVCLSKDSPDFSSTMDLFRNAQNTSRVFVVNEDVNDFDGRLKSDKAQGLMQDNFDDIFANVDTEAMIDSSQEPRRYNEPKRRQEHSVRNENKFLEQVNPRLSTRDNATSCSNGSDKENKCKNKEKLRNDGAESSGYLNVVNKCSRKDALQANKPYEKAKQPESLQTRCNPVRPFDANQYVPSREEGNDSTLKATCFEDDSLMDVTQHDLLLKQCLEDLLGKPQSSEAAEKKGHATPQKLKSVDIECIHLEGKDTEHSTGEDDIVENTPDAKTRSVQSNNSMQKGSSLWSPIAKISERQFASPSTVVEKRLASNVTPLCKRSIQPFYQSTPKAHQSTTKNNYVPATLAGNKRLEIAPSVGESFGNQAKAVNAQNRNSQGLCFTCSGLVTCEIDQLKRLAEVSNARFVPQFDQDVTHVIVKTDKKNNGANKTLKYLQGIAHRKWIVGFEWVIDSLKEKKLVNEEPYEAVDSRTLEAGPRNSRLREKGVFEGFVFLCIGPYDNISVAQYEDLLRSSGATVVDSLDVLAAEKTKLKIIVLQPDNSDYEAIVGWYKRTRAVPIAHDWVVECISQYKLISIYPYLQELSRQDVLALGYPEFLVEEEPDGDSDSACEVST